MPRYANETSFMTRLGEAMRMERHLLLVPAPYKETITGTITMAATVQIFWTLVTGPSV